MAKMAKTLQLERIRTRDELISALEKNNAILESAYRAIYNDIHFNRQAHIADADGTLADITTKFNTLLDQLEERNILETS